MLMIRFGRSALAPTPLVARLYRGAAVSALSLMLVSVGSMSQAAFAADDDAALAASDAAWAQAEIRLQKLAATQTPATMAKLTQQQQASAAAVNGCGPAGWKGKLVPETYGNANFHAACNWHDSCYAPGSRLARLTCDNTFKGKLEAECDRAYPKVPSPPGRDNNANCRNVAGIYYSAVRNNGKPYYKGEGNPA